MSVETISARPIPADSCNWLARIKRLAFALVRRSASPRRVKQTRVHNLSAHLRRDIGLSVEDRFVSDAKGVLWPYCAASATSSSPPAAMRATSSGRSANSAMPMPALRSEAAILPQ